MYTLKIVEWKDEKLVREFYGLADNITVRKHFRNEKEKHEDFLKRVIDPDEIFFFNPVDECDTLVSVLYLNDKDDYKTMVLFPGVVGYIMNETGKTVDRIVV